MITQLKEIDPTAPVDIVLTAIGRWAPDELAALAREHHLAVTDGGYELSPLFPRQDASGCGHAMPCTLITGTAVAFNTAVLLADKWREAARGLLRGSSLLILRDGRRRRRRRWRRHDASSDHAAGRSDRLGHAERRHHRWRRRATVTVTTLDALNQAVAVSGPEIIRVNGN